MTTKRALISVSDKAGLLPFCQGLVRLGFEILSTGGTSRVLREGGVAVADVSAFTGAPEILDGRVKTLHPKVHGGLLARGTEAHQTQLSENGMVNIDLVVVNLYPFRETVARGAGYQEIIENIDIGGPSMVRSAAKNHERVTVVVEPSDYDRVLEMLEAGDVPLKTRFELACKAFAATAAYDGAIAGYLSRLSQADADTDESADDKPLEEIQPADFGAKLFPALSLQQSLRYGENPHQKAAFYVNDAPADPTLTKAKVIQGKALSYNNLLDLDAAMKLVCEFNLPGAAIIKHTNPCGAAVADEGDSQTGQDALMTAFLKARSTDPVSAFGGIVACNREVTEALAKTMTENFLECVVAPAFAPAALEVFAAKKNLRVLQLPLSSLESEVELRSVAGGVLVQSRDLEAKSAADCQVVSKRQPKPEELADLDFAWKVVKHVKSNAIVFCGNGQTVGVGAGQMSRVDSVKLAVTKANLPLAGTVLASDAFSLSGMGLTKPQRLG